MNSCYHDYEKVQSTRREIRDIIIEVLEEEGIDVTELREKLYFPSIEQDVGLNKYFMPRDAYHHVLLYSNHMDVYDSVCLICGECNHKVVKTKIDLLKMRKNKLEWENRESIAERIYKKNCCK